MQGKDEEIAALQDQRESDREVIRSNGQQIAALQERLDAAGETERDARSERQRQIKELQEQRERDRALISELRESVARLSSTVTEREMQLKQSITAAQLAETHAEAAITVRSAEREKIDLLEQQLQEHTDRHREQEAADKQIFAAALSEKDEHIRQLEERLAEAEQATQSIHRGTERLSAMTELLSMDVDGEEEHGTHSPTEQAVARESETHREAEAALQAELEEVREAQSKLQVLASSPPPPLSLSL